MLERNPLPRYAQVAGVLRNRIRRGAWKQHESIPSIDRLMVEFGVGRVTVRQAIQILAREGLLSPEQGRGTFVTAQPGSLRPLQVQTSLADLAEMYRGDAPDLEHIVETDEQPRLMEGERAAALGYRHMRRVHSRDGRALLPRLHLRRPVGLRPGPGALPPRAGHPAAARTCRASTIVHARQTLDIAAADVDVARSLGVAVNAPIAEVRCVFVGADDTVLYVAEASHRGDYVHLKMDLLPAGAPQ